jgi:hypothetical protein
MYLVAIAWIYITLMMAVAEAAHPQGSLLGALITFVLYGLAPLSLVLYLLNSPARRRKMKQETDAVAAHGPTDENQLADSHTPNTGSESTTDAIAPVRKK